jgi:tetratricopeptide (TPR) repeat protein
MPRLHRHLPRRSLAIAALSLILGAPSGAGPTSATHRVGERDLWARHSDVDRRFDALKKSRSPAELLAWGDSLEAAARLSGDVPLGTMARCYRTTALIRLARAAEAESLAHRVIAAARARGDHHAVAYELRQLGWCVPPGAPAGTARQRFELAADYARRNGPPSLECLSQLDLANVLKDEGRAARAVTGYERARHLAEALGDRDLIVRALSGLGPAYALARDVPRARRAYHEALALHERSGDESAFAWTAINLGQLEATDGDPDSAQAWFRFAQPIARRAGNWNAWATCARNRAEFEVLRGRYPVADSMLVALIDEGQSHLSAYTLAALETQLAEVLVREERLERSRYWTGRALSRLDDMTGLEAGATAINASNVIYIQQRFGDAVAFVDSSLAHLASRVDPATLGNLRLTRATALAKLRRWPEALREYRTIQDMNVMRGELATSFMYRSYKTAQAWHANGRADSALALCRRAERAWLTERARVHDLALLQQADAYGAQVAYEYSDALLDPACGGTAEGRVGAALAVLERLTSLTLTERALLAAAPADARLVRTFDLDAFRRETLRPGEVWLRVAASEETTRVYCVSRNEVRTWMAPGPDDLGDTMRRFAQLVGDRESGDRTRWLPAARSLGRALFGPGADMIAPATSVFVSTDNWATVPLGLLVPGPDDRMLGEGRSVSFVPSALLLIASRSTRERAPGSLLAVGRTTGSEGHKLPAVAGELRELRDRYANVTAYLDPATSSAALVNGPLHDGDVLHFATHARASSADPWLSALLVGDPRRPGAWLTAEAISRSHVRARLCVMASCNSLGTTQLDAVLAGLAPAWLMAGVPTVVASQWAVDDAATRELMRRFYGALARGMATGEALRTAQEGLRALPGFSAPYWWAGFVVVGDPSTRVRLVPRS